MCNGLIRVGNYYRWGIVIPRLLLRHHVLGCCGTEQEVRRRYAGAVQEQCRNSAGAVQEQCRSCAGAVQELWVLERPHPASLQRGALGRWRRRAGKWTAMERAQPHAVVVRPRGKRPPPMSRRGAAARAPPPLGFSPISWLPESYAPFYIHTDTTLPEVGSYCIQIEIVLKVEV